MKALTICQPYAHLIITGAKRVENRTWPTRHRGWLAIHAGKSREWLDEPGMDWEADSGEPMTFGGVVGFARLVACLHIDEIRKRLHDEAYPWLREHEHAHGQWCWVLQDIRRLQAPISCKGAQGLWLTPFLAPIGTHDEKLLQEVGA